MKKTKYEIVTGAPKQIETVEGYPVVIGTFPNLIAARSPFDRKWVIYETTSGLCISSIGERTRAIAIARAAEVLRAHGKARFTKAVGLAVIRRQELLVLEKETI